MNTKILAFLTFCIVLLSTSALAAVTVPDSVTFEADYSRFDDDQDNDFLEKTVTVAVTNPDGQDALVTLEVTGLPSDYNATNLQEETVSANSNKDITFTIQYPHDKDGGESNVGTINVKQGGAVVDSATLIQDTRDMLFVEEIQVDYEDEDGDSESEDFDNEEELKFDLDKTVRIGSEVEITIKLENRFGKDYREGDIDNIDITIEADDDDLYEDFDEDVAESENLDASDDDSYRASFFISNDADEGDYTLEITVEGEDDAGAKYTTIKEIQLEIEREKDQITVTRAQVSPSSPLVCDAQFSLDVEIENTGTDKQAGARLTVESSELGISEDIKNLVLEEYDDRDNSFSKVFSFKTPKNLRAGTYPIEVKGYYDERKLTSIKTLNVEFKACENQGATQDTSSQEQEETQVVVSTLPGTSATENDSTGSNQAPSSNTQAANQEQQAQGQVGQIVRSVEDPYTSQDVIVAAIIIAVIIIVAMIVVFFILLFRR